MKLGMKTKKLGVLVSCKAIKTTCHDDRSLMNTLRAHSPVCRWNLDITMSFFLRNFLIRMPIRISRKFQNRFVKNLGILIVTGKTFLFRRPALPQIKNGI